MKAKAKRFQQVDEAQRKLFHALRYLDNISKATKDKSAWTPDWTTALRENVQQTISSVQDASEFLNRVV